MELTIKRLNLEHISWNLDNGNGRSTDDLRFGQFIHNKYNVECVDVFYVESAQDAYEQLLTNLTINDEGTQQNG